MIDHEKPHEVAATRDTGTALFTIYRSLFSPDDGDANIKRFQLLAAQSFGGQEPYDAFVAYLKKLNGGVDPELSHEQIQALAYFMRLDQNAYTVRPWEPHSPEMW